MEDRYKNQGKFESKSNYEKYAEKKQKKLLEKTVPLQLCISMMRENAEVFSEECMDSQYDMAAQLFGLSYNEIKDAVHGEKYWCI